jgi:proline racemase
MRLSVSVTEYHTAGEPFRIVTGGIGPIAGQTVLEKRRYAREHLDHIRRLVINEPRGHADMYGCFLTDPDSAGAAFGTLFFHNERYSTACGHGTIALATWAVEHGIVEPPAGMPRTSSSKRRPARCPSASPSAAPSTGSWTRRRPASPWHRKT